MKNFTINHGILMLDILFSPFSKFNPLFTQSIYLTNLSGHINRKVVSIIILSTFLGLGHLSAQDYFTVCSSGCDYTSITNAISGASSGIIYITLLDDNYNTGGITISENSGNITIRGRGQGITKIRSNTNANIFTITGRATINIEDLTIEHYGGATGRGVRIDVPPSSPLGANVTFNRVTIQNNHATSYGGAVLVTKSWANVTFTDCVLKSNTADNGSGALDYDSVDGTLVMTNTSILNNQANGTGSFDNGGGITLWQGTYTLTNCTIGGNTAANAGGGLYVWNFNTNNLTMINCTVANNTASNGIGGMYSSGVDHITNCIIADNTGSAGTNDLEVSGSLNTNSNNIVESCTGGCSSFYSTSDPNLGSLSTCGVAEYYPLQSPSAAIDGGTSSGAPTIDVCGHSRSGNPDIGAKESGAAPTTLTVCSSGCNHTTISGAIGRANASDILSVQGTISDGAIDINKSLTITGNGNSVLGDAGAVFYIVNGVTVTMNNLKISNAVNSSANGGGVFMNNTSANLVMNNCSVSNCKAENGAGIYCTAGNITMTSCLIEDNEADLDGGGLHINHNGGTFQFTNCSISDNRGGMSNPGYNIGGAGAALWAGNFYFTSCTIDKNDNVDLGAGIYFGGDSDDLLSLFNCTLTSNAVRNTSGQGSGLYQVTNGVNIMYNNIIYGNTHNSTVKNIHIASSNISHASNIVQSCTSTGASCPTWYSGTNPNLDGPYHCNNSDPCSPYVYYPDAWTYNEGFSIGAPSTDICGTLRYDCPDIGSYEGDSGDYNGCNNCDVTINSISQTHETCNGGNNGSITNISVTYSGVINNLEYSIDGTNFQSSENFDNLSPGTYTVTARDKNDHTCSTTSQVVINSSATACTPAGKLHFDGTDDYIEGGNNSAYELTDGTIELWFQPSSSSSGAQTLVAYIKNDFSQVRYLFNILANISGIGFYNGPSYETISYQFSTSSAYHLAFVDDGTETKVYVNGTNIGAFPIQFGTGSGSDMKFYLGSDLGTQYFNGMMDEVRIWDTALSQSDISTNKDCQLTGTENNLVAYYNFNNGLDGVNNTGLTTLEDQTSNNLDCTLTNFGLVDLTSNWRGPGLVSGSCVTDFTFTGTGNYSNTALWSPAYPGTNIQSGWTANINGTCTMDASVTVDGTLNINTSLEVSSGQNLTHNGTITNNGTLMGAGTVNGSQNFTNPVGSTVAPGSSAGCLVFSNNFTNNGTVEIEIGGTTACTQHDQIQIGGTATLGGTLNITLSYTPAANDEITIIDATALSGNLTTVNGLSSAWQVLYNHPNNGEVTLKYDPIFTFTGTGNYSNTARWSPTYPGTNIQSGWTANINGTCTMDVNVTNDGTMDINTSLEVSSGQSLTNNGTLQNDGTLLIPSGGTVNISATGSYTHNGSDDLLYGTMNNAGSITIESGTLLRFSTGSTFNHTGSSLAVLGQLYVASTGELILNGDGMSVTGVLRVNSGSSIFTLETNKTLTIETAGKIRARGSYSNSDVRGTIQNNGLLELDSGKKLRIKEGGTFIHNGTSEIEGEFTIQGSLVVNAGKTLTIKDTGDLHYNGTSSSILGELLLESSGSQLDVYSGKTLTISSGGTMQVNSQGTTNAIINGTLQNNGILLIPANGVLNIAATGSFIHNGSDDDLSGTMNNAGSVTIESGVRLDFGAGSTFNHTGTSLSILGTLYMNNSGELILNGDGVSVSGFLRFNSASSQITLAANKTLTNESTGTIVSRGSLGGFNILGTIQNNGNFRVDADKEFKISTGGTLIHNGTSDISGLLKSEGTIIINDGKTLTVDGTLDSTNGMVTGMGTLGGSTTFTNMGELSPGGSPGCINLNVDFVNTGVINIELEDGSMCTNYDHVNVTAAATIGGTINVTFPAGQPVSGSFVMLTSTGTKIDNNPTIIWPTGFIGTGQFVGNDYVLNFSFLPVELVDFSALLNRDNTVQLSWETATEINNEGFEIQRSQDAQSWQILDFVNGKGNTNQNQFYSYDDLQPRAGINYYRLRQIDFDGGFEYSSVVSVEIAKANRLLKVYPNPVQDGLLSISFSNPYFESSTLSIYNAVGQLIKSQITQESQLQIETSDLQKGVYWVGLEIGGKQILEKVVVQ